MYKKYVFLGLGGSGGKTLRFLKHELRKWLDENGAADRPMPDGWQFLHIDTPTVPDGLGVSGGINSLDQDEYLGLVGPGVGFNTVAQVLDSLPVMHDELQTWRVEPANLGISITDGAGQFRAVGKMISLAYLTTIKKRIQTAIDRVNNAHALSELGDLYSTVTGNSPGPNSDTVFVIVSSLAGGTGAGLLFPVSDLVRAMEPVAGGASYGLLYTPEVFTSLGAAMVAGTQPNSLAAISELLNGYWLGASDTTGTSSLIPPKQPASLQMAGAPTAISSSGPRFPFLIGRTGSGGVAFDTPADLYQMVGRALVSWVVDPAMSEEMVAYVKTSWELSSMTHFQADVLVGGAPGFNFVTPPYDTGYPCVSGMGFSRLSVGSDWFELYSARRVAYQSLKNVVGAHIELPEARAMVKELNSQDPNQIAEAIASRHIEQFLTRCQLNEFGLEQNQIQDSLRPKNKTAMTDENISSAVSLAGIESLGRKSASNWQSEIVRAISQILQGYPQRYLTGLETEITAWIQNTPNQVIRVSEEYVARYGLKVTAAIVRQATTHIVQKVVHELQNDDYNNYVRYGDSWRGAVEQAFQGVSGQIESNDERLINAIQQGFAYGEYLGEATLASKAASLLLDFAGNFLAPLSEALETEWVVANEDLKGLVGWPEWNATSPPTEVCPPISELVLIEPDEYPGTFTKLLEESVNPDDGINVRDFVTSQVTSGSDIREAIDRKETTTKNEEHLLAIVVEQAWWPGPGVLDLAIRPLARARFKTHFQSVHLFNRAKTWLNRPMRPFSSVFGVGLRDYLADGSTYGNSMVNPLVYQARQNKFRAHLQAAIAQSAPLVGISQSTMALVHPQTTTGSNRHSVTSQIPLRGHPLENDVVQILRASGFNDSTVDNLLSSETKLKSIDFSSILWPPHSPLVIDSLMRPIAEVWNTAVALKNIDSFWSRRRAAKVSEFSPVPQGLFAAMSRGWLTAGLMGLLERKPDSPIRISDGSIVAEFPYPLLSPSPYREDNFTQIMEALSIAYVNVSLQNLLTPLKSYQILRDLGRSRSGSMYNYDFLNPELEKFLREQPNHQTLVPSFVVGTTVIERAASAVAVLKQHASDLSKIVATTSDRRALSPSELSEKPLFTGTWSIVSRSIEDLIRQIEPLTQSQEVSGL